jgi:hypothetical protein
MVEQSGRRPWVTITPVCHFYMYENGGNCCNFPLVNGMSCVAGPLSGGKESIKQEAYRDASQTR